MEAATGVTTRNPPEPHDIAICISCAGVLMWDENMRLISAPHGMLLPRAAELTRELILERGVIKKKVAHD